LEIRHSWSQHQERYNLFLRGKQTALNCPPTILKENSLLSKTTRSGDWSPSISTSGELAHRWRFYTSRILESGDPFHRLGVFHLCFLHYLQHQEERKRVLQRERGEEFNIVRYSLTDPPTQRIHQRIPTHHQDLLLWNERRQLQDSSGGRGFNLLAHQTALFRAIKLINKYYKLIHLYILNYKLIHLN